MYKKLILAVFALFVLPLAMADARIRVVIGVGPIARPYYGYYYAYPYYPYYHPRRIVYVRPARTIVVVPATTTIVVPQTTTIVPSTTTVAPTTPPATVFPYYRSY